MRPVHERNPNAGMTLVELMVTLAVLSMVLVLVGSILFSSNRVQTRTARRVEVQAGSRNGMSLMTTELRQAGADPSNPPIGVTRIVAATDTMIRIRADMNGDGVITTTEPSEDVTYSFDVGQRAVFRNPGAGAAVVMANVDSMLFTYFDAANAPVTPTPLSATDAARVRTIGIRMTSQDRDSRPITLTTRVTLRNI